MESVVTQTVLANLRAVGMLVPHQVPERSCYFLKLPSELRHEIADYLDTKRDIYNLSQTCRAFEDVVARRLYKRVYFDLPEDGSVAWNTGGYLTLRPNVIQATQELVIGCGAPDRRQPQFNKRRLSNAGSSQAYAARLLQQVPGNQLTTFSTPMSPRLLQLLSDWHARSLQDLRFFELQPTLNLNGGIPQSLRSLECHAINDGDAVARLISANKNICRLVLGQERELLRTSTILDTSPLEQPPEPLLNLKSIVDLATLPHLQELSLVGLDLSSLIPEEIETALWFTRLTSLNLESCTNADGLLAAIAQIFHFVQAADVLEAGGPQTGSTPTVYPQPALASFSLRTETLDNPLRAALPAFLTSFSTLKSLALLLSPTCLPTDLNTILTPHASLTHLTLEVRLQPRTSLPHDTSRPFTPSAGGYTSEFFTSAISTLTTCTPSLTELSIGFPWKDEILRLRPSPFPDLKHLKTMHIRNFPESHTHLQLGDYSIREYATKFTEWVYGDVRSDHAPQLETLSIGPTIYETRYKGLVADRQTHIPEFLRCHHFALDWTRTRFGRWAAVVTAVNQRYMEEVRDEKPLAGVFDALWLR